MEKKRNWIPTSHHTKINATWIKDRNMKGSILKLSEENIRLYLYNLKGEIDVSNKMPKSQTKGKG